MKSKKGQYIRINQAAEILGVSAQTVRNWEKAGQITSERSQGGQRYYVLSEVQHLAQDLPALAWAWASSAQPPAIPDEYYCERLDRFTSRLTKMGSILSQELGRPATDTASLLTSVAGEIGDNSFAHNTGNWPDVVGIFFAYDVRKRIIVLADRGRGVRLTLQHVRPTITTDLEAARVAFTETISGRSPEKRGNGLKVIRHIAETSPIGLIFNSGVAQVAIPMHGKMRITTADRNVRGVVANISFQ